MERFTGMQYLMIDIANNFGLDKTTWNDRLDWFKANQHQLMDLMPQAAEPALYFAGIRAYEAAQAGLQSGYPISLDATSSGLQLLAVLTGDRKAAEICNVVDAGYRADAYSEVYTEMVVRVGDTAKISREMAKDAIMTSLYGSKAVPKTVFGEGKLLNVFYQTMNDLAPACWELNQFMLDIWDANALSNEWVLPDNFNVKIKVMAQHAETVHFLNEPFECYFNVNAPVAQGRSLGANTIHSLDGMIVREITRRCDYSPSMIKRVKEMLAATVIKDVIEDKHTEMVRTLWQHYVDSGYLSARILQSLRAYNVALVHKDVIADLIKSLPAKPFKVISIHDCFRVLPNYGNDLREQYNLQLKLIAQSSLLTYMVSQIMHRYVAIAPLDPTLVNDIMDTNYALS